MIATMHPAYFALVMATGIVSIAAHLTNMRGIAYGLFLLNGAFYVWLWALTTVRVVRNLMEVPTASVVRRDAR